MMAKISKKNIFFGEPTYYISFYSKFDSKITGENRFKIGALVFKLYAYFLMKYLIFF